MQRNKIAAVRILWVAAGTIGLVTIIASWSPFSEIKALYERIEAFSGTCWIADKNANRTWPRIVDRLNTLAGAVPPIDEEATTCKNLDTDWQQSDKAPPILVPIENFRVAHDKNQVAKWRGTRYKSGKISYEVNYGFGVMTRAQATQDEMYFRDQCVMLRVMKEVVGWVKEAHDNAPELYAQGLAKALKLDFSDHSRDMGINSIYIGSSNGNAAFFPASNFQLTPKRITKTNVKSRFYDPRLRPWYEAATGMSLETEKSDDAGLSFQYLDYSDKVSLVRTAWKTVELDGVTYVVAIDIMLYGDDLFKQKSIMGNTRIEIFKMAKDELWESFISWGLPFGTPLLVIALVILLGGFRRLRDQLSVGRSLRPTFSYEFRRSGRPVYWQMENEITRIDTDIHVSGLQTSRTSNLEIGISNTIAGFFGAFKRVLKQSESEAAEKRIERNRKVVVAPTNVTERCIEVWNLFEIKSERRRCQHCQKEVSSIVGNRNIAEMIVSHRDHDDVDVFVERWDHPKDATVRSRATQQALAKHSAVGGEPSESFLLVDSIEEINPIPPQVKALDQINKHLSAKAQIDGGRIGYGDGVSIGFPLYNGVSVEAVCDPWYLDQLLKQNHTDILLSGTRVRRILFIKNERDIQQLLDDHGEAFVDLVMQSSKRLWYIMYEDLPEPFSGFNKWDFAVLEYGTDKAVVMISDTTQFCNWSFKADVVSEGVTGELSWRRADVEFYHALFEIMYSHKRDLRDVVSELVVERPMQLVIPKNSEIMRRCKDEDTVGHKATKA